MAGSRIKGITVEIGGDTTGLSKALSGINGELRDTQSQLRDVEKLLKLDPENTELLRQKFNLLSRAVEQTEEKLDALRQAEKQVQAQFERGEVSEDQYNALRREIIATENSLDSLRDQAKTTQRALMGIDKKPLEEVADAAEKAGNELEDAGKEASSFGDYLKAGAVIEGVTGIASAISDLNKETQEFRKVMGTLETSSERAGYTAEQTSEAFDQLYWVLGDEQSTATTIANLQAIGLEQSDLLEMLDLATGAWATYGDSIPIDGLAESINETIRAGTVTGTFADVLNWGTKEGETFGVMLKENTEANEEWNSAVEDAETAEDYFNLALQNCSNEAERANLVMQAMASQGLADSADAWYQNNASLVDANDAQLQFMEASAQLAEKVTPVTTSVKEGINGIFNALLELSEDIDFEAIASAIDGAFDFFAEEIIPVISDFFQFLMDNGSTITAALISIAGGFAAMKLAEVAGNIKNLITGVSTLSQTFPALGSAISLLTNPVFLVGTAVVALVALIATKGDEIQQILQDLDDWLQDVFTTDWSESLGFLGDLLNGFFQIVSDVWGAIKKVFDGIIDFIRGVFTGDWDRAWQGVSGIFEGIFEGLVAIAKAPLNAIIALINGMISGINWVIDKINGISFDIPDWLGGGHIGFDLDHISKIAYLAKGGILTQGSAIVGEAGPELLTVSGGDAIVRPLTGATTNNYNSNMGGITVNVYGAPGQDVKELAHLVSEEISDATSRKGAVYA